MNDELKAYCQFADKLLDSAAEISRHYFGATREVTTKADGSIVTKADKEIEALIRAAIESTYPDHGIIGEEQGEKRTKSPYSWIIDPIDGTKAFAAGYPTFCTLIGLLHENIPILGMVDQPILNKRWQSYNTPPRKRGGKETLQASQGGGSLTSDDTTMPPPTPPPQAGGVKRLIATTSMDFMNDAQLQALRQYQQKQGAQLIYGGDAYAYMMLLEGRLDAVFDIEFKPYDILPILPILETDNNIHIQFFENGKPASTPTANVIVSRDRKVVDGILNTIFVS